MKRGKLISILLYSIASWYFPLVHRFYFRLETGRYIEYRDIDIWQRIKIFIDWSIRISSISISQRGWRQYFLVISNTVGEEHHLKLFIIHFHDTLHGIIWRIDIAIFYCTNIVSISYRIWESDIDPSLFSIAPCEDEWSIERSCSKAAIFAEFSRSPSIKCM
jgi:hypothetical protein